MSKSNAYKHVKKVVKEAIGEAGEAAAKETASESAKKKVAGFNDFRKGKGILRDSKSKRAAAKNRSDMKDFIKKDVSRNSSYYSESEKMLKGDISKKEIDKIMSKDRDGYLKKSIKEGKKLSDYSKEKQISLLRDAKKQRIDNPTISDHLRKGKAPEVAVGLGSVAFLTSRLSETKGKLTNAQLFGRKPI